MRHIVLYSFICLLGCGAPRYENASPKRRAPVSVRVEADALLTSNHAAEACRVWSDTGAVCLIVPANVAAEIVITADYQRCPTTNGGRVFAVAESCRITVFMDCFLESGSLERPLLRRILAHELGHAFGIDHVPRVCELGRSICGEALMNAVPELSYLTAVDNRAFDVANMRCRRR